MTSQTRGPDCLSNQLLDRMLVHEVSDAERARADAHRAACRRCAGRWQQRQAEQARFRADEPPFSALPGQTAAPAVVDIRGGRPARTVSLRRRVWLASGAALAAAAGVALLPTLRPPADRDTVTSKGGQRFAFYVKHGEAVREGEPGEVVRPGDALRFGFDTARIGGRHVAVLSRDAAGKVTVFFPDGDRAVRLDASAALAPFSVVLDDTLGEERLHAVFCDDAAPVRALEASLAPGGAWPAGCDVEVVSVTKQTGR